MIDPEGFKVKMTKQELIEKEKMEIEAIKNVLEQQGMDPEEIENYIGKTYQVNQEDIKVAIAIEALEIDEDDLPQSLRTENKRTAGSLDTF